MEQKFNAIIKEVKGKGGAYIEIPFNVEEVFEAKRVKVKATFDGEPYRGSVVRMGTECHIIGITKAIRDKINKGIGDEVLVTMEKDSEERIIVVPLDLKLKLEDNVEANNYWNKLSYSNKKKYVNWIESAKKQETRNKRLEASIEKLINQEKM